MLVGQEKIAGSAQRRTQKAVLQHGSIILGNRFPQQPVVTLSIPFEKSLREIRLSFTEHFARLTGETLESGDWFDSELEAAAALVGKYAGDEWTRRR